MKGALRMSEVATTALFGYKTSAWITGIITVSILGALNVVTMIGPRIYYAMAKDGVFFHQLTYVHPNFGTPTKAILLQALWSCLLILTNTWGTLFTYVSVVITLFSAFTVGSVIVLRFKRPELTRPYRLWGYPLVPILFVLVHLWIVWGSVTEKPKETLIGLFIVCLGIPAYLIWRQQIGEINELIMDNGKLTMQPLRSIPNYPFSIIHSPLSSTMAVRINKVYTRTGDRGETSLVGGKRVAKDSSRVEAYGAVDELNSIVGLARVFNEEDRESGEGHRFLDEVLCQIQDELFDIGSELATPPEFFQAGMYRVGADEIKRLEKWIDHCQKDLEPLQSFILPGGGRIGAYLHQCRTVCRRVERDVLRLSREETINDNAIKYLNRLSDLFFVLARWISHQMGEPEYLWQRGLHHKGKSKK